MKYLMQKWNPKKLVNKSDIYNLVKNFDLNTKAEVKSEQDKIVKLQAFNPSYFHDKNFFSNDNFQNMLFINQQLKDKGTVYAIGWKWKDLFKSKFLALHSSFLPNIKYLGYKERMQLNNTPSVAERNNWATKNSKNSIYKFYIKNCLFGAANITKNNDKTKWVHSGYGVAFDGKGDWSFGNDSAGNFVIFGVDNSSSYHSDNHKTDFLVLGEEDFGITGNFGVPGKRFSINFSKTKTKFYLSLHCNGDNSYLFVNGEKIYKFKTNNRNVNSLNQFCLGSIFNKPDYDKA